MSIFKIREASSCIHFPEAVAEPGLCPAEVTTSLLTQWGAGFPPQPAAAPALKPALPGFPLQHHLLPKQRHQGSTATGKVKVSLRTFSLLGSFVQHSETQNEQLEPSNASFCCLWELTLQCRAMFCSFQYQKRSLWQLKFLDYKFLVGFFGPSSGELWATRDMRLPMRSALGSLCWGGCPGQHVPLVLRWRGNPCGSGKPPCFVSHVLHVKNFPTVIDFSCQDQGEHVHPAWTAPARSSGPFFYPFSFLLNNYWGS